jgi:hypothetical protein
MQWIHYETMNYFLARPDHFRTSITGFNFINLDVVEMAMAGFPEMFWLWAAKHMSHFCGVRQMKLTCGFWDHSWCP